MEQVLVTDRKALEAKLGPAVFVTQGLEELKAYLLPTTPSSPVPRQSTTPLSARSSPTSSSAAGGNISSCGG